MKLVKKLLTIAVALTMVLGLGTRVFAADYDETLTITGLTEEDVVHFYKIVEWVGETEDDSDVAGWKAVAPFDDVLDKDTLTAVLVGTPVADDPETEDVDESEDSVPPTGITAELAGQLAKLVTDVDPVEDVTVGDDGKAVLNVANDDPETEDVDESYGPGVYMALITPADVNTVYNPVFVSSDYNKKEAGDWEVTEDETYGDEAAAKKSTLDIEKTAANDSDYTPDAGQTTAVGDTVTFTVTTTIPGYGTVYENPHFVLTDELTALELKEDEENASGFDIVLSGVPATYVTDPEEGTEADSYTIAATKGGYTITFAAGYLKTVKTPQDFSVVYKAIVTSEAEYAVNEEDNEVYIEYSHDPSDENDYDLKKDTTQHYTFSLDAEGIGAGESEKIQGKKTSELVKIGVDAAGNPISEVRTTSEIGDPEVDYVEGPLEGAVFGLFTDEKCENPYYPKDPETGEVTETALTAESKEDGRMNFKGLDAGTYYLKEISAPAGYVTDSTVHTVVIEAEVEEVTVTEYFYGNDFHSDVPDDDTEYKTVTYKTDILKSYTVTIDDKETAKYTFTNNKKVTSTEIQWDEAELVEHPFPFTNVKGTELPSTGGMGTTLFYTIGGMLVIGAGILLVSRRRMAE